MRPAQLRTLVIKPTLAYLNLADPDAEDLLVGISCAESLCGEYLSQMGSGPALGIYQMEPDTAVDVLSYLEKRRPDLYKKVVNLLANGMTLKENLAGNNLFATAMARCFFLRFPEPIPASREGMAAYWKKYYNTKLGAGTVDGFLRKWKEKEEH